MRIKIKDININYTVNGEGDNYLLLHGWGANIDLYKGITNNIAKYAKVFALDLPGFGKSDEPEKGWSLDDFVEFIIEFIEKMEIKKVNLIGHSFGGRVIIKMLNRKDLNFEIEKVILIGSAGIKHELSFNKKMKIRTFKIGKKILSNKIVKKAFPDLLDKFISRSGSSDYRNASPVMKECMKKAVNEELTNLLPEIKNEVLLIWGENDTETPIEDGILMNKLIKNSGLVKIRNGSHFVFIEQTQYVNKIIDAFLR
ncbi:MAG TPA: alpha/beta hydrolase [Clostridia bacterium]|nr:alpha/beta hydrolase [Clostridia bacterium]